MLHNTVEPQWLEHINYHHMLPDLAPWLNLSGSNYRSLEQISMVPKMFEPLKFDCVWNQPLCYGQSDWDLCLPSYDTVSCDSVSGQQKPWSGCQRPILPFIDLTSQKHTCTYIILTPTPTMKPPLLYSKTGVYRGIHYFSFFCSKTNCEYKLGLPQWDNYNEYTNLCLGRYMKNIRIFIWKLSDFWWWNFQYIWIGVFS